MSAFLGPIHHWLYNKIMIQEQLVEDFLKLNEIEGYVADLKENTDNNCGILERRPLEEMIDTDNIHGWLQERVTIVERRLAYVVTAMTKEDDSRMEQLLDIAYETGEQVGKVYAQGGIETADQAYKLINDIVLDGMPCDRINEMVESTEDHVVFRQTRCIHEEYWLEAGGLVMKYYDIRRKLLQGVLVETPFELVVNESGDSVIRRK